MKIEIEKVIASYFDLDSTICKIKRSRDGGGLWSIHVGTKNSYIPQYINVYKNLLMNPHNYSVIAGDLKVLLEKYVHGD